MGVQGMSAPVKLQELKCTNYRIGGSRRRGEGRTLKSAGILDSIISADDLGQSLILTYPLSAFNANGRKVMYTKQLAWACRPGRQERWRKDRRGVDV